MANLRNRSAKWVIYEKEIYIEISGWHHSHQIWVISLHFLYFHHILGVIYRQQDSAYLRQGPLVWKKPFACDYYITIKNDWKFKLPPTTKSGATAYDQLTMVPWSPLSLATIEIAMESFVNQNQIYLSDITHPTCLPAILGVRFISFFLSLLHCSITEKVNEPLQAVNLSWRAAHVADLSVLQYSRLTKW